MTACSRAAFRAMRSSFGLGEVTAGRRKGSETKAAGGVLTVKASPRRPNLWADFKSVLHGTAPALGLRAWEMCHHSIADQPRKGELTMSFQSWLQNLRFAFAPARAQRRSRRR